MDPTESDKSEDSAEEEFVIKQEDLDEGFHVLFLENGGGVQSPQDDDKQCVCKTNTMIVYCN